VISDTIWILCVQREREIGPIQDTTVVNFWTWLSSKLVLDEKAVQNFVVSKKVASNVNSFQKDNETIIIEDLIYIKVIKIDDDAVEIGIEAPKEIQIFRTEIYESGHSGSFKFHAGSNPIKYSASTEASGETARRGKVAGTVTDTSGSKLVLNCPLKGGVQLRPKNGTPKMPVQLV
jgi:carbon storage regulator CsrA